MGDDRGSAHSCGFAVMAKASRAGLTKTRLAPPLTPQEAAAFNTAFLQDIAANLIAASREAPISGYMAYSPAGTADFFRQHLPAEIGLIDAWGPSLGDCLTIALQSLFERGHEAACVLNSDSPTLPVSILVEASRLLAEPGERAVFGPSTDGGYYLLGVKRVYPRLFEDISWSTEQVAEQTLARAREIGLEVAILPEWYDVDDAAALRTLAGEVFAGAPFRGQQRESSPAQHSAALLRSLLSDEDAARRLDLGWPVAPFRAAS